MTTAVTRRASEQESAFLRDVIARGRARHRRPEGAARRPADRAARRRPRAARRRARAREDARGRSRSRPRSAARSAASSSRPTCCPPTSLGTHVYNPKTGDWTVREGPGLRELRARRRDQPRAGEGPVRAARGDAGAAGHARGRDARAARAVPRARDAEPDRARGHVSAARSAGRPLHAEAGRRLPDARTRRRRSSSAWRASRRKPRRAAGREPASRCSPRARCSSASTSTRRCSGYVVDLVFATREPERGRARRAEAAHPLRRVAARLDRADAGRARPRVPRRAAAT